MRLQRCTTYFNAYTTVLGFVTLCKDFIGIYRSALFSINKVRDATDNHRTTWGMMLSLVYVTTLYGHTFADLLFKRDLLDVKIQLMTIIYQNIELII